MREEDVPAGVNRVKFLQNKEEMRELLVRMGASERPPAAELERMRQRFLQLKEETGGPTLATAESTAAPEPSSAPEPSAYSQGPQWGEGDSDVAGDGGDADDVVVPPGMDPVIFRRNIKETRRIVCRLGQANVPPEELESLRSRLFAIQAEAAIVPEEPEEDAGDAGGDVAELRRRKADEMVDEAWQRAAFWQGTAGGGEGYARGRSGDQAPRGKAGKALLQAGTPFFLAPVPQVDLKPMSEYVETSPSTTVPEGLDSTAFLANKKEMQEIVNRLAGPNPPPPAELVKLRKRLLHLKDEAARVAKLKAEAAGTDASKEDVPSAETIGREQSVKQSGKVALGSRENEVWIQVGTMVVSGVFVLLAVLVKYMWR